MQAGMSRGTLFRPSPPGFGRKVEVCPCVWVTPSFLWTLQHCFLPCVPCVNAALAGDILHTVLQGPVPGTCPCAVAASIIA